MGKAAPSAPRSLAKTAARSYDREQFTRGTSLGVRSCLVVTAFVAGLSSCISNNTEVITPPPPPPGGPLTLRFVPDPEDAASAQALGWATGIPGADVTVTPKAGGAATRLQTTAAGTAAVTGLVPGDYTVELVRWLSAAERGRLAPGDDALGFLGSAPVPIAANGGTRDIEVPADRQKSVIISEWAFHPEVDGSGLVEYSYGGFLELYNNADTTVFLDGLVIGQALAAQHGYPKFPCGTYDAMTLDPNGLWARFFEKLPGRGNDYPLNPGETAVIATDAIDHSKIVASGLDLTTADFEFKGSSDPDNPSVPNTVDVGVSPTPSGRGLLFFGLGVVAFLSRPVNAASLPQRVAPLSDNRFALVPRDSLLDVMAIGSAYDPGYPECGAIVNARFDRKRIQLFSDRPEDATRSYQRGVALNVGGAHPVLRHTRTTAADFSAVQRSPHRIQ